jgi:hypothetical protein
MQLHAVIQGEEGSMAFWLMLQLVNLVMGFLIGYCFRAANEARRHKPETLA